MKQWILALGFFTCGCLSSTPFRGSTAASISDDYRASYRIRVLCKNGFYTGSGFAVSPRHIVTAKHVAMCGNNDDEDAIGILVEDYTHRLTPVTVDKLAKNDDAARLVVDGTDDPFKHYVKINLDMPELGDRVCSIGGDGNRVFLMRKCGEVVSEEENVIAFTIPIVPGNSGSGLRDDDDNVIGIVVRGNWKEGEEHYGLAVPTHAVKELFEGIEPLDLMDDPFLNGQ